MKRVALVVALLAIPSVILMRHRSGEPEVLARVDAPVAQAPAVDYSQWDTLYENASLEQVDQDIALLRGLLDEGTTDFYKSEFSSGNYAVEGHFSPKEPFELHKAGDELCARRFLKSGEVLKVVLPRDQFQEMYELRDQIAWLVHRQSDLQALKVLQDRAK